MKLSQSTALSPLEQRQMDGVKPEPMDYVRLYFSENHITVGRLLVNYGNGIWVIEDTYGEVYSVIRMPELDTCYRAGWQTL